MTVWRRQSLVEGHRLAFAADQISGGGDADVRDRQTDRTKVVRRGEDDCASAVTGISPSGRFVTFYVECPYIAGDGDQIFIYDRAR